MIVISEHRSKLLAVHTSLILHYIVCLAKGLWIWYWLACQAKTRMSTTLFWTDSEFKYQLQNCSSQICSFLNSEWHKFECLRSSLSVSPLAYDKQHFARASIYCVLRSGSRPKTFKLNFKSVHNYSYNALLLRASDEPAPYTFTLTSAFNHSKPWYELPRFLVPIFIMVLQETGLTNIL